MTCDTSIRDHKRVIALEKEFKSVFTMSEECDDDDKICDQAHHLKHKMNRKGASALIKHLDGQALRPVWRGVFFVESTIPKFAAKI